MKILICIGITVLSSVIGYGLGGYYRKRKNFYCQFYEYLSYVQREISFKNASTLDIFSSSDNYPLLKDINEKFIDSIKKQSNIMVSDIKHEYLSEEEKIDIANFLNTIGRYNVKNQIDEIKIFNEKIKTLAEENKSHISKYGNMYIKLGVIIGLAVSLLII